MSVLNPSISRVTAKTRFDHIVYTDLTSALYQPSGNSIRIWNLQAGLFGSVNGTTYSSSCYMAIALGDEGWQTLALRFYIESQIDQNITLTMYQMSMVTTLPFWSREIASKLLSIIVPTNNLFRFSISDALTGPGGIDGGSTASNDCHYRVLPGLATRMIGISMTTSSTPTTGRIYSIDIGRTS